MTAFLISSLAVVAVVQAVLLGVVVRMFLTRQKELEELALIESKERRDYLAQASARMAVQTDQLRHMEYGTMRTPDEFDPLTEGNRRMREVRP
jgi:hypothetical protein